MTSSAFLMLVCVAGQAESSEFSAGELARFEKFKALKSKPRIPEAYDVLEVVREAMGILKRDPETARKAARESFLGPSRIPMDKEMVIRLFGEPDFSSPDKTYDPDAKGITATVPCTKLYYLCGIHESGNQFSVVFVTLEKRAKITIQIDVQSILLPQEIAKAGKELPASKVPMYERIIAMVQKGELKSEADGKLNLPNGLKEACVEGKALATKLDDGHWRIAFRFWRGRHENMMAFMYSTRPIADTEWQKFGDGFTIEVGGLNAWRHAVLGNNWFLVGYHMD